MIQPSDNDNGHQGTQYIMASVNKGVGVEHLKIYQSWDIDVFPLSIEREPDTDDYKPQGNKYDFISLSQRKMCQSQ